ncbi:MAG: ribose 5-phosphate isomerase B [Firmicutes bacterium ZCTH02-B6]|nr:MAG: ribose 5-phosphate isomerase B [Firmicutes bacterium ZCTH02-B6]
MRIAIGSDHAGFELKKELAAHLEAAGYSVVDMGTESRESCDYPDYAQRVAEAVAAGQYDRGILVCGTGIGMSIAANKVPGVRAALCAEPFSARMAREHNDANVLCLGARVVGPGLALEIADAFLAAQFAGGRHARRVDKIRELEK